MSQTIDALLAAVRAEPEEDTQRLVVADWFAENGQTERAEIIWSQCRCDELTWATQRWIDKRRWREIAEFGWLRKYTLERGLDWSSRYVWGVRPSGAGAGQEVWATYGSDPDSLTVVFRRGFVAELRGPLSMLRLSVCDRCRARGRTLGDPDCRTCDGRGRVGVPGTVDGVGDCPDCGSMECGWCHGNRHSYDGVSGGLLENAIREQPVENAVATDKAAYEYADGSVFARDEGADGRFLLTCHEGAGAWDIPAKLYRRMDGFSRQYRAGQGYPFNNGDRPLARSLFPTAQAAAESLSRAVMEEARAAVATKSRPAKRRGRKAVGP